MQRISSHLETECSLFCRFVYKSLSLSAVISHAADQQILFFCGFAKT